MQGGKLDGNRGRIDHAGEWAAGPDRDDRGLVRLEIAGGVGCRQRAFAEHVKRVSIGAVVLVARAVQSLINVAPHHELVAHDLHRLAHGETHHRLAASGNHALDRAEKIALGLFAERNQPASQHQAPGACVHEH
jgi:hypothetical protein